MPVNRHVVHFYAFYVAPPILTLLSLIVTVIELTGVVPMHSPGRAGVFMTVVANSNSPGTEEQKDAKILLGMLGSCYRASRSSEYQCTKSSFWQRFSESYTLAGTNGVDVPYLPPDIPDTPWLVLLWLCLTIIAMIPACVASLPVWFPKRFAAGRMKSRPIFTVTLVAQAIAWVWGFTAVLSIAQESLAFQAKYNNTFLREAKPILNFAGDGNVVVGVGFALGMQAAVFAATLVCRETSPTKESEMYGETRSVYPGLGASRRQPSAV